MPWMFEDGGLLGHGGMNRSRMLGTGGMPKARGAWDVAVP